MPEKSGKLINCCECNVPVYKTQTQILKTKKLFCSRKCSCQYGSRIRWQNHSKKMKTKCSYCDALCDSRNTTGICQSCSDHLKKEKTKSITKGELRKKHNQRQIPKWYSSEIRNFNRDWNKSLIKLPCQNCGYSKHVELAHIKPVADFPDEATLKEINSPENNLVLCPNCHWEFDEKLLLLENIPPRKNGALGES